MGADLNDFTKWKGSCTTDGLVHGKEGAGVHPGGNPGANLKSISHRCHPILVAFVCELTKETIDLPLGCLQGGQMLDMVAPSSPGGLLAWFEFISSPQIDDTAS